MDGSNGAAPQETSGFVEPAAVHAATVTAARMVIGLPDVADLTEIVEIGSYAVELRGVSLDVIAKALADSDELQNLVMGQVDAASLTGLLAGIPGAIARCVADAVGKPGDPETIDRFRRLPSGYQLRVMDALIRLSFPGGLSPFVDLVGRWFGYDNASQHLASAGRALGTSSSSSPAS